MEAFKERLIAEYVELDERVNKLSEFILKILNLLTAAHFVRN